MCQNFQPAATLAVHSKRVDGYVGYLNQIAKPCTKQRDDPFNDR